MRHELVFTIGEATARAARRISLAEAGLKERADLQEWIRENPQILGDGVRIITYEFDKWVSGSGNHADRLDLLGLDPDGRLVLAELKRDGAPDFVASQAIRYAAYASRFTEETIASCHGAYLRSIGEDVSDEEALTVLDEHCGGLDAEILRSPRIILVAGEFPEPVTASVVWLCEQGLDITLVQTAAYQSENDLVLTVSQLWPLPEVEDFTISPRATETRVASKRTRAGRNAVAILVESDALLEGAVLRLQPTGGHSQAVTEWIANNPDLATATWRSDQPVKALEWKGERWSASGLAEHIIRLAAPGSQPSVNGAMWWVTENGTTLADLAGTSSAPRDWSDLHELLARVRPGEWVSYRELADAIGSGPIAVGRHIAGCVECENGWRVMGVNGASRDGFHFTDPSDERSQVEVLESEGLTFVNGRADPASEVSAADLRTRG